MKINIDTPVEEARIELIPLIDVIFCILTFFLLAALQLTRQQAISVDLPKASTGQPQIRQMLIVGLDAFGRTYIDQRPVSPDQLMDSLQDYRATNPTGLLVLYASKDARYNNVVQVLDQMREVGGDRVALATLPGESDLQNPQRPLSPLVPGVPQIQLTPNPNAVEIPVTPGVPLAPVPTQVPVSPAPVTPSSGEGAGVIPGSRE